jgi:fucose permease
MFLGFSVAMTAGRWGTMFLPNTVGAIRLILLCVTSGVLFSIASFARTEGLAFAACILVGLTESYLWPTDARCPSGSLSARRRKKNTLAMDHPACAHRRTLRHLA